MSVPATPDEIEKAQNRLTVPASPDETAALKAALAQGSEAFATALDGWMTRTRAEFLRVQVEADFTPEESGRIFFGAGSIGSNAVEGAALLAASARKLGESVDDWRANAELLTRLANARPKR